MTIVVKIGGSTIKTGVSPDFLDDLKIAHKHHKVVLVHGGAIEVTRIAEKMGKAQQFIVSPDGMRSRYTDKETAEIFTMVMAGKINKEIVATLLGHGIPTIGISGVDGALLKAERKKRLVVVTEQGRKRIIDGGHTGKINLVDTKVLEFMLQNGYLPVIAPVAISEEFESLNVDSDRAAAYIAGSLKVNNLIFLTDVPGIYIDNKVVPKINVQEARRDLPKIGHGMKKKVYAAIEALNMGVKEAIITSGLEKNPISAALTHSAGTVIYLE